MIYNDLLRGCGNNEFLLEDERFIFNGEEVAVFLLPMTSQNYKSIMKYMN